MARQNYYFVTYPDGVYHSRAFPKTVLGREQAESWRGAMDWYDWKCWQTDKRTYEKYKDGLGGKCELCREGEGIWSDGSTKICEKCARKSSEETQWVRDMLAAEGRGKRDD